MPITLIRVGGVRVVTESPGEAGGLRSEDYAVPLGGGGQPLDPLLIQLFAKAGIQEKCNGIVHVIPEGVFEIVAQGQQGPTKPYIFGFGFRRSLRHLGVVGG